MSRKLEAMINTTFITKESHSTSSHLALTNPANSPGGVNGNASEQYSAAGSAPPLTGYLGFNATPSAVRSGC